MKPFNFCSSVVICSTNFCLLVRGQGRDYYTFAFDDPEEFFEEDSLPGWVTCAVLKCSKWRELSGTDFERVSLNFFSVALAFWSICSSWATCPIRLSVQVGLWFSLVWLSFGLPVQAAPRDPTARDAGGQGQLGQMHSNTKPGKNLVHTVFLGM